MRTDRVLITDYAWPDLGIEQALFSAAGIALVAGPAEPASARSIEALVREHQPVAILTNWAQVSAEAVRASAGLRTVARLGVGLDNIAVEACTARGVRVTNVPDFCVEEVSDHALALLLAWSRGIVHHAGEVRAGRWQPGAARLRRLANLTIGLVGYGRIGSRLAQKLAPFGATLLCATAASTPADGLARKLPLDDLLPRCDALVVTAPLTAATRHLLDAARIARMKSGAVVVNVSRGAVIDTAALIDALERGHLAGAMLDVLEGEPDVPARLLAHPGVIVTPHIAFTSDASLANVRTRACAEVIRVLRGEAPMHPCNEV